MNSRAADALRAAALLGVPQIKHQRADQHGGRCALGVIGEALFGDTESSQYADMGLDLYGRFPCHAGCSKVMDWRVEVVTHLNNVHGWDFLKIANTLEEV